MIANNQQNIIISSHQIAIAIAIMDLNKFHIILSLKTPNSEGHTWFDRTKRAKIAALKICNKNGTKEIIDGLCSNCRIKTRNLVEKEPSNPHFGCTKECCPLLYQWNMCSYCIQDTHFPVIKDENSRHSEVVTFQNVFSKLPDDIQHYIGEYVPHMFSYLKSINQLIHGHLFCSLERQLKLPKSTWIGVMDIMQKSCLGDRLKANSSRKKIFDSVKCQYKIIYNTQFTQFNEEDFWTHKEEYNNISRFTSKIHILQKIQTALHA